MSRYLFILFCTIGWHLTVAQWTQTNGPQGIEAVQIEKLGEYLFVGGSISGLYRSADGGETWEFIEVTPFTHHTRRLIVDGSRIYCTTPFGLFYSDDFGLNWDRVNTPFVLGNTLEIIDDEIYVQDFNYTIYYTLDFGANWEILSTPDASHLPVRLKKSGSTLWLAAGNLYYSSNYGVTWETHEISDDYTVEQVFEGDEDYLYAKAAHRTNHTSHVLISEDDGVTWTEAPYSFPGAINTIDIENGTITLTSYFSINYIITSFDHGQTWESKDAPEPSIWDVLRDGQTVYTLSTTGIDKSVDNDNNWDIYVDGLKGTSIEKIAHGSQGIFAIDYRNGVSYSSDLGLNWEYRNNGLGDFIEPLDIAVGSATIFIATSQGVYKTVDEGLNWIQLGTLPTDRQFLLVSQSSNKIVAVSYLETYFSEDDGDTWNPKAPTELNNEHYTACFVQGDMVVLASETQLKVSTNFGDDWSVYAIPSVIREIEIMDNKIMVATDFGIYETSDFGANWNKVNTDN
ncbi:MAG TPA: hypothetical protein PKJ63_14330, partial [Cyclobacteriaceae bacterium]|nr:hypothetical protein [Cyclobacteriaceae bacterium]